jgi:hypothetical protein
MSSAHDAGCSVLLQDGRILVIGGSSVNGAVSNVDIFGTTGTWSAAAPMQSARAHQACAVLQTGQVLVAGGDSGASAINTAELYDPSADKWSALPVMTQARSGATASVLQDGRVLIAGGGSNALEIFDPNSQAFSFVGTMSAARQDAAAAVLQDGRVLIVGGSGIDPSTGNPTVLASSDIYDPNAGAVSAGPTLSVARSKHSATTQLDGKVVVIGGSNGSADLNSIEIFDPVAGNFSSASASLATPRSGHLVFLLPKNNEILVVGGQSAGADLASAELYVPWGNKVQSTGSMTTARSQASGSSLSIVDGLLMVASGSSQTSAEMYTFATVKTDASDYAPYTPVTITGTGWQPGETVTLTLVESPPIDTHPILYATADANGNIVNTQFSPDSHDLTVKFYLTATGSKSQAQNTFTDAIGTATAISSSSNPSFVGGSVTFTATVTSSGTPVTVGTVDFRNGGNSCSQGTTITTGVTLNSSGQASTPLTTFASSGSFTIRACYNGTGGSGTGNSNASLTQTVNKITPVITWANPVNITYGTALSSTQLNATASVLGTFIYSPVAGTVLNAGSGQTLSVTFTPTDTTTYNSAAASVTINVNQAGTSTTLGSWTQFAPTGTGPAQGLFGMSVVEDGSGNLIMFGGSTGSTRFNDVWVLSGGNGLGGTPIWNKLSPAGSPPAARYNHMAVYDSITNSMIIYGGCEGGCFPIANDAWVLSHANGIGGTPTWSLLTSSGPSTGGRQSMAKVYDPTSNRAIIFGGQNGGGSGGATFPEVWVLTNANGTGGSAVWSQLTTSGTIPPGQYGPSSLYDVTNNRLTVAGGAAYGSGVPTNAVYVLTNANGIGGTPTWTNLIAEGAAGSPAGFGGYPAAYDATNNRGILVESGGTNNIWLLSNANGTGGTTAYSHVTPSGGVSAVVGLQGAAYDPASNRVSSFYQNAGSNQLFVLGAGSPDASAFGQSATFTATVSPVLGTGSPTGTVTFKDGATTLGTGPLSTTGGGTTATFTTSGLSVGTHTITAVYGADGNFTASTSSWALTQTVARAAATVTLGSLSQTYSGLPETATATTNPSGLTVNFTYNGSSTAPTNVGSYTVVGTISDPNYQGSATGTLVISKATPTIMWSNPADIVYGTALSGTQLNATALVGGTFTYNPAAGTVLSAGSGQTLSVHFVPTDTTDYNTPSDKTVLINVTKATPTITWSNPPDIEYGIALSATQLNATASVGGTFAYSPAADTVLKAGSGQTLSVTFTPTDTTDYSSASKSVAINVTALTTTCSITAANKTYDGTTAATVSKYTVSPLLVEDTVTCSSGMGGTTTFADKNVGNNKTVTATGLKLGGKDAGNYVLSITTATAIANITPLAITVTAATNTKQYDGTTSAAGVPTIAPALATGDTPNFTEAYTTKNAGSGLMLIPSGSVNDNNSGNNYAVTFVNNTTGVITTRAITVTAATNSKGYDGTTSVTATPTITSGALQGTDTANFTETYDTKNVGTGKTLTPSGTVTDGNSGNNYTYTFITNATGAITARAVTVTADAKSKVYGSLDPAFTYNITSGSLVAGDSLSGNLTRASGESVGSYAIQQGTLTAGSNYALTYVGTNLTITAATASVTPTASNKIYGQPDPPLSGILNGFLPSDNVSAVYSRTPGNDVGTYTISAVLSPVGVLSNYNITYNTATFTIAQAIPAVTAVGNACIYSGNPCAGSGLAVGVLGEPLTPVTLNYSGGSVPVLAGNYTVTASFAGNNNYTPAASVSAPIAIQQATPIITWTTPLPDITYGTALSSTQLNATTPVSGTFVYTPAAGMVLPAGSQTLSVAFTPTDGKDYTTATASVTINVNKAVPTIVWDNPADITYGTALSGTQLNAMALPNYALTGWWKGEGDATDAIAGNTGTLLGGTTYTTGARRHHPIQRRVRHECSGVHGGISDAGQPDQLRLEDDFREIARLG